MNYLKQVALGILALLVVSGCEPPPVVSCDLTSPATFGCYEFTGADQGTLDSANSGCFLIGTSGIGCAPADVGRCDVTLGSGVTQTYYFYSSETNYFTAMALCGGLGGTWML